MSKSNKLDKQAAKIKELSTTTKIDRLKEKLKLDRKLDEFSYGKNYFKGVV